jgi:hypothetical protein
MNAELQTQVDAILDELIPAELRARVNRVRRLRGLMPLLPGQTFRDALEQTREEIIFMYGGLDVSIH